VFYGHFWRHITILALFVNGIIITWNDIVEDVIAKTKVEERPHIIVHATMERAIKRLM
jgi:hypothetical protein